MKNYPHRILLVVVCLGRAQPPFFFNLTWICLREEQKHMSFSVRGVCIREEQKHMCERRDGVISAEGVQVSARG